MKTSTIGWIIVLVLLLGIAGGFAFTDKAEAPIVPGDSTGNTIASSTDMVDDTGTTTPSAPAPSTGAGASGAQLDGKTFTLVSYKGQALPAGQAYTLSFEDGRIGTKFCNGAGGEYTITGNVMKALIISTMMYCAEPANLMTMENDFGKIFNDGATFAVNGTTLTLSQGGTTYFTYKEVK